MSAIESRFLLKELHACDIAPNEKEWRVFNTYKVSKQKAPDDEIGAGIPNTRRRNTK